MLPGAEARATARLQDSAQHWPGWLSGGGEGGEAGWGGEYLAASESFVSAEDLTVRAPKREKEAPWGHCRESPELGRG